MMECRRATGLCWDDGDAFASVDTGRVGGSTGGAIRGHSYIEATDHEAERAIRPAVVSRKVFGGNRTRAGARAQEVLCSVLRTCQQRACDAYDYIANVLRTPFRLGQPITPIAMPVR